MTRTSRFCVATSTRVLLLAGLAVTGFVPSSSAESYSPLISDATTPVSGPFDASPPDQRPPSQFGAYQYLEPYPRSHLDQGLQFSTSPTAKTPPTTPDYSQLFGHTIQMEQGEIQQTQYPLDNESPATDDVGSTGASREPRWIPPVLASPEPLDHTPESGWVRIGSAGADATHVVGTGNTLGFTTLTARVALETPRFPAFSVRPTLGWHNLNGPRSTDLPSQLYDVSVEMRMYWPFGDRWLGEFAIAPGLFTDFQNTGSDAVRIVGRGVGYYRWSPELQLAIGAAYLDRQDVSVIPVAGVVWTPTPDDRLELLVPRPRLAHRFRKDGSHERWVYVAGEFGGGSWAIERTNGTDDIATYRDFRLITGIEFKFADKSSWRVEGGYVFGRELEYDSNIGNYQPRDTTMIRAALNY